MQSSCSWVGGFTIWSNVMMKIEVCLIGRCIKMLRELVKGGNIYSVVSCVIVHPHAGKVYTESASASH